jgi:acyl-CoA thioesterase
MVDDDSRSDISSTATTADLSEATAVSRLSGDVFRLRVPGGWRQGRGAFGGLVLGALTRAMEACEPDGDRVLRSLSGAIGAPVPAGDAEIHVKVLRRGNAVSTYEASLLRPGDGGDVLAHATAVFGRKRQDTRAWSPVAPPAQPSWAELGGAVLPQGIAPEFTRYFELRPFGALPFGGGPDAVADGYVRAVHPPRALGAPELVALADVWWPATFAIDTAPRPIATVAFTLQLFTPPAPLAPERPLRHRARAVASQDGYVVEMRELWTESGALLALNQQTFVMIK